MSESRRPLSSNGGYLSIREVLDSLIGDFDDITISKIRFLESRGLIHPERTPSGYRKFYPKDVERLRWILKQQRENFLPLKVIKRRLDVEDGRVPDVSDNQSLFDDQSELHDRDLALANVVSNIREARRPPGSSAPLDDESGSEAVVASEFSAHKDATSEHTTAKLRLSTVLTDSNDDEEAKAEAHVETSNVGARHPNHPSQAETLRDETAIEHSSAEVSAVQRAASAGAGSRAATPEGRAADRVNDLMGVTLSTEELAAAASTTAEAIAELEEFGFISSQAVAGVPCFGGEALVVAKAIVGLRPFGLEPRHLKSVRNAAERDASLYAQAVAPLLRQRNPDARAKAKAQLDDLAERGASLYEQILRLQIRRLGGA